MANHAKNEMAHIRKQEEDRDMESRAEKQVPDGSRKDGKEETEAVYSDTDDREMFNSIFREFSMVDFGEEEPFTESRNQGSGPAPDSGSRKQESRQDAAGDPAAGRTEGQPGPGEKAAEGRKKEQLRAGEKAAEGKKAAGKIPSQGTPANSGQESMTDTEEQTEETAEKKEAEKETEIPRAEQIHPEHSRAERGPSGTDHPDVLTGEELLRLYRRVVLEAGEKGQNFEIPLSDGRTLEGIAASLDNAGQAAAGKLDEAPVNEHVPSVHVYLDDRQISQEELKEVLEQNAGTILAAMEQQFPDIMQEVKAGIAYRKKQLERAERARSRAAREPEEARMQEKGQDASPDAKEPDGKPVPEEKQEPDEKQEPEEKQKPAEEKTKDTEKENTAGKEAGSVPGEKGKAEIRRNAETKTENADKKEAVSVREKSEKVPENRIVFRPGKQEKKNCVAETPAPYSPSGKPEAGEAGVQGRRQDLSDVLKQANESAFRDAVDRLILKVQETAAEGKYDSEISISDRQGKILKCYFPGYAQEKASPSIRLYDSSSNSMKDLTLNRTEILAFARGAGKDAFLSEMEAGIKAAAYRNAENERSSGPALRRTGRNRNAQEKYR